MNVRRIRLHRIRLPFRRRYAHAQAVRTETDALILEVELDSGERGFGEALPRAYVTGETMDSVADALAAWAPAIAEEAPTADFAALTPWLESRLDAAVAARALAAYGACELALLDAVGNRCGRSVSAVLEAPCRERIHYTGPISAGEPATASRLARLMRLGRLRDCKVKVGFANDVEVVRAVRDATGADMDIRVDANGAWSPDEAIARINVLGAYHISAVEQPVTAKDLAGMATVQRAVDVPLVADESACTVGDVERLAEADACRIINVRVGKCGGLLGVSRVARAAERCGLEWHIGCLVGETALLSAAGRHFAFATKGWRWAEGSYGAFLLRRDIAKPQPRWGWGGSAKPLGGVGLGVRVIPEQLAAVTVATHDLL